MKGTNFVDLRDAGDPVELAERYDAEGADELVFLDITATSTSATRSSTSRARTADDVFIPFTIGGGIRSVADAQARARRRRRQGLGELGRGRAPELMDELAERFGAQCVVLAIDAKRRSATAAAGRCSSPAAARPTGRDAVEWAREGVERGAGEILLTSMDRDGTEDGYDLELDARGRAAPSTCR